MIKKEFAKELELMVKSKAALIFNCFGYINIKPEHLILLDYETTAGTYEYISIKFQDKYFQLQYYTDEDSKNWKIMDVTEYR